MKGLGGSKVAEQFSSDVSIAGFESYETILNAIVDTLQSCQPCKSRKSLKAYLDARHYAASNNLPSFAGIS